MNNRTSRPFILRLTRVSTCRYRSVKEPASVSRSTAADRAEFDVERALSPRSLFRAIRLIESGERLGDISFGRTLNVSGREDF